MTTDVILLKPVPGLGAEGDKVTVKSGYARNFLLPHRIATLATQANVRQLEELKKRRAEREAAEMATFRELADKIAKLTLSIPVHTGPGGKLFGAVTTHHIAEALAKEGVTVEHRHIELKQPIHALGTFDVGVTLHPQVTASLKFSVVSSSAPGTEEGAAAEAKPKSRKPREEAKGTKPAEAAAKGKGEAGRGVEKAEKAEKAEKGEKKKKK